MEWSAGTALKLARAYHGLSLRDLSERLSEVLPRGVSHATLAKVEKGSRKIKETELAALVEILDFPREWYLVSTLKIMLDGIGSEETAPAPGSPVSDRPRRLAPKPPEVDEHGRYDDGLTPGLVPTRRHNHPPEPEAFYLSPEDRTVRLSPREVRYLAVKVEHDLAEHYKAGRNFGALTQGSVSPFYTDSLLMIARLMEKITGHRVRLDHLFDKGDDEASRDVLAEDG